MGLRYLCGPVPSEEKFSPSSRKAYGDMGLDPGAVASLLSRSGADALVCGHVHWGQRFTLDVEGLARDVVVLSSWDTRGSFVRIDEAASGFTASSTTNSRPSSKKPSPT